MTAAPRQPSRWTFHALWVLLAIATVSAVVLAARSAGDDAAWWRPRREPAPILLLTAAPQDGEVFLTWSPLPGATYRVRWRPAGEPGWHDERVGPTARRAVTGLRNGAAHEFQVEALSGDRMDGFSGIAAATPRPRPDCVTLNYVPGPPAVSFFCTKAALDAHLAERSIDPLTLRCRQQPVTAWDDDIPDCHYVTPEGEHLLLLRSADNSFSGGHGYPAPAVVREHARRALWGRDDPFDPDGEVTPPLTALETPLIGNVKRHASARSFRLPSTRGTSSTLTWFMPAHPAAGRFSIYHEGHGGAAVEIGAGTIDWLLERGWQVIALDMPLLGANRPAARPGLQGHADFESLDNGIVSPLQHFLLPVKSVVDAIAATAGRSDPEVLLIGRSGGGWTTYVYAALDPRIDIAVAVAGGRPMSTRLDAPWGAAEVGDYEQSAPHLYTVTSHEHLMLAAGSRAAFYVFNRWDTCCYRAQPDDPFVRYLRGGERALGKPIGVFVDRQHRDHSLGPRAYDALERFLARVLRAQAP